MARSRWYSGRTAWLLGLAAFILVPRLTGLYGEWLWFGSLGFPGVFLTILYAKAGMFAAGFLVAGLILYAGHRWTVRNVRKEAEHASERPALLGLTVLAVLFGFLAASRWETALKYLNASNFAAVDPVFSLNVGFYVFSLPFLGFVADFLMLAVATSLIVSLVHYAVRFGVLDTKELMDEIAGVGVTTSGFDFTTYMDRLEEHAYNHLNAFLGVFFLVLSASIFLARYGLLFSQGGTVFGIGHTASLVSLPVLTLLTGLTAFVGLSFLANLELRRFRYPALGVAAIVVIAVLGGVAGWAVQSYVVEPDEFNKERSYIEHEINFTRDAYALDRVSERNFPVSPRLTREQIDSNPGTIENVRLWDWRPLLKTYNELQIFRTYYTFTDVDIDRYRFNGSYRQVMLSPREIDFEGLPPESRSWVNRHLVYTHGFGLTMSPVREVREQGLPELVVKDIPPTSTVGIDIEQPRIYYGEETDTYAIVNTGTRELDYPSGDRNVYAAYQGDGGVQLDSVLRELVYSVVFGAPQIFFSDSVEEDSRIQFHRDVKDRVRTVAPFLEFDRDPYMVAANGRLYWMYDAYTTTDDYPYSRPVTFRGGRTNYVRNSVKVVVDAYTGDMNFYVAEPDDPLIQTYGRIFPDMFSGMEDMPDALQDHVRYPEDLFSVQAEIYRDYHMKDPNVFYNREDQWRVPNEILRGNEIQMEPYYIIMTLPGEESPEFVQILPFIPRGKENMIGWLAARSDQPAYGELQAFQFSKQELVFGPMQVESRIDQDADISQQITLWSQSGSDVLRGNLLAIPIDDTIIYVEPLFLESREQGALPELKRVIVAHGDRLTMQPTLDDALAVLFGEKQDTGVVVPDPGTLAEVRTLFREAQAALQRGDFATYGEKTVEIEELLQQGGASTDQGE